MHKQSVFRNFNEYGHTDLAARYRSTAGTQEQVDPALLDEAMQTLEREGYVIFERLIPEPQIEAIKKDVLALIPNQTGRNNFEGFSTQRIYAVIEKTFSCNALVEHPLVLGLLDRILEPNYLLSQLQAINILPGEEAQPLHYDDAFYPWPRPRRAIGAASIFAIDPFTRENGATVVIPKSHLWGEVAPEENAREHAIPVVMPPGSMVFFLGTLWHSAGANRSKASRLCVTAQYCAPWCRQQ